MPRTSFFGQRIWLAFGLLALLALPRNQAHAGQQFEYADCQQLADGSGFCEGNFLGFRNLPDASSYIRFTLQPNGMRTLEALYNHRFYSCVVKDSLVTASFDMLMLHRDAFHVDWNPDGVCTAIALYHGSAYSNY